MARDANVFDVTIIRPRADEVPEEVGIGIAILAKIIAGRIRKEHDDVGSEMGEAEQMLRGRLPRAGDGA